MSRSERTRPRGARAEGKASRAGKLKNRKKVKIERTPRPIGRPRLSEDRKKKNKVMRVSEVTYMRLKKLKTDEVNTYDEVLDQVLRSREIIRDSEKMYLVNGQIISGIDLAEARGMAIEQSVKLQMPAQAPGILLYLGEDDEF